MISGHELLIVSLEMLGYVCVAPCICGIVTRISTYFLYRRRCIMKKRIATSFLCSVFLILSVATASAFDLAPYETLAPGNGFVRIGEGGFGDSANSYSWSVLPFKDNLYVGTNRHHLHSMMEALTYMPGSPITPDRMPADLLPDAPLEPRWFYPAWAEAFQGEIWRYNKQKQWERVHKSGVYQLPDGRSLPVAYGYRCQ